MTSPACGGSTVIDSTVTGAPSARLKTARAARAPSIIRPTHVRGRGDLEAFLHRFDVRNHRAALGGFERAAQLRGREVAEKRDAINVTLVHVQTLDRLDTWTLARKRQVHIVVVRLESHLIGRPRPGDDQLDHSLSLSVP